MRSKRGFYSWVISNPFHFRPTLKWEWNDKLQIIHNIYRSCNILYISFDVVNKYINHNLNEFCTTIISDPILTLLLEQQLTMNWTATQCHCHMLLCRHPSRELIHPLDVIRKGENFSYLFKNSKAHIPAAFSQSVSHYS